MNCTIDITERKQSRWRERDEVSKDFYSIIWNYGTEWSGKQKGRGVIFNQVQ